MNSALKNTMKRWAARVDELVLRERALIFIGGLVVLYVAAVNLLFAPLWAEQKVLNSRLEAKRAETQQVEAELKSLLAGRKMDPDAANRAKLNRLEAELRNLDASLAETVIGLVSPQEIARLVEQILVTKPGLELISIESLPADSLTGDGAKTATGVQSDMIYRHGVRVEFRGRYGDIVKYLKALEALPWKMFWGEVALETERYPMSRLTLVLYTLGLPDAGVGA